MCSRYTLICDDGFSARFGITGTPFPCHTSYNVPPGRLMPVIVRREANEAVMMKWGLIPHWAKDAKTIQHPINARAETVAEKPMFRGLLKNYRCLVPATGFYEWKKNGLRKVPYYVRLKGGDYFSFAGLYDLWRDPQGLDLLTYTIITTAANDLVEPIHDRMPVIVHRGEEDRWLSASLLGARDLHAILAPYPAGQMEAYPVEGRVNNPNMDEETLIRPLTTLV